MLFIQSVYFTSKVAIQIMYIINLEGVQAHIQYEEGKTPYDMKEGKPLTRLLRGEGQALL